MLKAFIRYNSGDYDNDERDKEKFLHLYVGGDHAVADRDYNICSSETATKTACRFSSRSEDEQDRTEAIHS